MNTEEAIKVLKENKIAAGALLKMLENRVKCIENGIEHSKTCIKEYEEEIERNEIKLKEDKNMLEALKTLVNK